MYGLTELAREQVKGARLVANPGCYPTCAQLPLRPFPLGAPLLRGASEHAHARTHPPHNHTTPNRPCKRESVIPPPTHTTATRVCPRASV